MKGLTALLILLTVPLALMNMLGGVVTGIWLAVLGQWGALGIGLLLIFFGTNIISIALIPMFIFVLPSTKLIERGRVGLGALVAVPGALYTVAVMVLWCYVIFTAFITMSSEHTIIPMLLWSYEVATGSWNYMAHMDSRGHEGFSASSLHAVFISVGYLLMVIMRLIGGADVSTCLTALVVVMVVACIIQIFVSVSVCLAARQNTF